MPFPSEILPPHLQSLSPSQWAMWRWFVLRGAGFPAQLIHRLAPAGCASAADEIICAEDAVEKKFQAAIAAFNLVLERLAAQGTARTDESYSTVLRARRRLSDGKVPTTSALPPDLAALLQTIRLAMAERDRLRAQFTAGFPAYVGRQSEALRGFACDARFQEAVIWQNRQAFETAVQPVARTRNEAARNQRQRNREHLIARYAQRYCVKNDSIGFFGPVVWGKLDRGKKNFEVRPGPSLTDKRQTYLEAWAVDRLAESLSLMEGMDWWVPPVLAPEIFIEDGRLHRPELPAAELSELEQAVLAICNGKNLPGEILRKLHEHPKFHGVTGEELRDMLRARAAEGVVLWRFLVPVEVNPEKNLREQLSRIGDTELQARAMECLGKLEAARAGVSEAAGRPIELNEALRQAELVFENLAKIPGHRNAGTTYGARTILYEDCRRDLALRIAPDLLEPIVPALALLLKSLRWLMQATALEFYRIFRETFAEMAAGSLEGKVRLIQWWTYTEPKLLDAPSINAIEAAFRQKWSAILPVADSGPALQFHSGDLKQKVDEAFPEFGAGHYPVRYFCPDLMLAAKDAEAIERGELLYVLGEIHSGKNSLGHVALVEQHPDVRELVAATQWDLAEACFKIVTPQRVETTTARTTEAVLRPRDLMVTTTSDSAAPSSYESHPIGDLMLQEQDGELYVASLRNGRRFHLLEAFSDVLFGFMVHKGSWVRPDRHVPRVMIDKLVVHRESWRFRRHELEFALEKDEAGRFLGARRWMKTHHLPRKCFVKSAGEMKPFYLDLESPILVEGLCRAIHNLNPSPDAEEEITISEMLPDTEQLWLQDAAGNRYTSELRMAAVDLEARARSEAQLNPR